MNEPLIIKMRHVRMAHGGCLGGAKIFCARYGIDYKDFLANGVDAERLLSIDDAMGHQVVEAAQNERRRQEN